MDPFSDEILGVKIQLASLMEKIQQYQKAIDILEIVRGDCLKWIDELGSHPGNEGKRTRVLAKTVGISVKLGELYANEYVMEKEAAEERLVWAVETVLREQQRRGVEGVKPDEGPWMSPEEIGGSLEGQYHIARITVRVLNRISSGSSLRGEESALPSSAAILTSDSTLATLQLSYDSFE